MQNKISEEQMNRVIESGINVFSEKGFANSNINVIAKNAGISVGTLYNYFGTKEDFFLECLRKSIGIMEGILNDAATGDIPILKRAEKLIRAIQKYSKTNARDIMMYHQITGGTSKEVAQRFAKEIEGATSRVYSNFIREAIDRGEIRSDANAKMFAFFFDNMLMMLQFSYCCEYYKERIKMYCGDDIFENDEKLIEEMLKFFESAFTFEQSEVKHDDK